MKKLLTITLLFFCLSAYGQDSLKVQMENLNYNLARYKAQRQRATYMAVGAVALIVVSYSQYTKGNNEASNAFFAGGAILGGASLMTRLGAEKWLVTDKIALMPNGIKVYF